MQSGEFVREEAWYMHGVYEMTCHKKKAGVVTFLRRARQVISPPHCVPISSQSICSRQNMEVSCVPTYVRTVSERSGSFST